MKTKLLILMSLLLGTVGCAKIELEYSCPIWENTSNTIYCTEREYTYKSLFGLINISEQRNSYLISMDTNGENCQRLIYEPGFRYQSIVDDLLVYWNYTGEYGEIYSMNMDGSNKKKIIDGSWPELSPDGTKIAYILFNETWIINLDGTENKKIGDARSYAGSPAWSVNCSTVAYAIFDGICITNIETLDSYIIEFNEINTACKFNWSPDGTEFVYNTNCQTCGELRIIGADGNNDRLIYENVCGKPRWSPDGNKIIGENSGSIYTINKDATGYKVIVEKIEGDRNEVAEVIGYID